MAASFSTLLLATTPLILYQMVYIHNNIIVATYMLIGVAALWTALNEKSSAYLQLGIFAFLGLSLSRTEVTLFAAVFFVAAISFGRFSNRDWLKGLAPYSVILTCWNLWLLLVVKPDTHILTPTRTALIIAVITGLSVMVTLLRFRLIRLRIAPNLHYIMLTVFSLMLLYIVLVDFQHLVRMAGVFLSNLFSVGWLWWGVTWWIIAAWLWAVRRKPDISGEKLFVVGITGFFMLITAISYVHPFRIGWSDSANRAFTHILPVIVFYLTLKTAPLLFGRAPS